MVILLMRLVCLVVVLILRKMSIIPLLVVDLVRFCQLMLCKSLLNMMFFPLLLHLVIVMIILLRNMLFGMWIGCGVLMMLKVMRLIRLINRNKVMIRRFMTVS